MCQVHPQVRVVPGVRQPGDGTDRVDEAQHDLAGLQGVRLPRPVGLQPQAQHLHPQEPARARPQPPGIHAGIPSHHITTITITTYHHVLNSGLPLNAP